MTMSVNFRKVSQRGVYGALALAATLSFATSVQAAVVISLKPTSNVKCSKGWCAPTAKDAVLNVGDLESMLASGSVTVTTTGKKGLEASDLKIVASVNWSSGQSLSLVGHYLTIDAPILVKGLTTLYLDVGYGSPSFGQKGHIEFANLSSAVVVGGMSYTLVDSVASLASAIDAQPNGAFALARNYNAKKDGIYSATPIPEFTGNFEGLGNEISNLSIAAHSLQGDLIVGLFGNSLGRIDNLRLVNADVSGQGVYTPELGGALIGGMVSENSGTMFGDSISGVVSAIAPAPEAAPEPARRIQNFSGGLVGGNDGWIFSSRSTATVKGAGGSVLGGLVGDGHGGITDSYFAGTVIMDNWGVAGGLIGSIAGGSITSSFSSGSVIGRGPNAVLGGLVGSEGAATNSNCYSTASVTGTGSRPQIGGLIGIGEVEAGSIATSYSIGAVTHALQADGDVAGFVSNLNPANAVTDDYWDTTTSGTLRGDNYGSSPGLTGLSTAQLQSGLPAGFDSTIWAENPRINNGFPYLIANPPQK